MCGIGGISLAAGSKFPVKHFMHELLLLSEDRGRVASGWAYNEGPKFGHFKQPIPGGRLKTKSVPDQASSVLVHTRNSTTGSNQVTENNHPVISPTGDIMLVHNGVVTNHDDIKKHKDTPKLAEVDTSVLPWLLESYSIAGLNQSDGWAAVAWLDKQTPGVIHLARLQKAPLVLCQLKDGTMVFGSTYAILEGALKRVGFLDQIVFMYEVGEWTYIQLKDGKQVYFESLPGYSDATSMFKPAKPLTWQQQQDKKKQEERQLAITEGKAPATSGSTPTTSQQPTSTPTVKVTSTPSGTPSKTPGGTKPSTGGTSTKPVVKGTTGGPSSPATAGSPSTTKHVGALAELEAELEAEAQAEANHVYDPNSIEARMQAAVGGQKSSEFQSKTSNVVYSSTNQKAPKVPTHTHGTSESPLPDGVKRQDTRHRFYYKGWYYSKLPSQLEKDVADKRAADMIAGDRNSFYFSEMYGTELYLPKHVDDNIDWWVSVQPVGQPSVIVDALTDQSMDTWFQFLEAVKEMEEAKLLVDYGFYSPTDVDDKGKPMRYSLPRSVEIGRNSPSDMAEWMNDYYVDTIVPKMVEQREAEAAAEIEDVPSGTASDEFQRVNAFLEREADAEAQARRNKETTQPPLFLVPGTEA